MIRDMWTIVWKELKELIVARAGHPFTSVLLAVCLVTFAVVMPWWWGRAWLQDPRVFWVWVLLPIPLVITAAAESFAGERERHTLETLLASPLSDRAILTGKIVAAALYGWITSLAVLLISLITVNFVHATGTFLLYSPGMGAGILTFGLLASLLTACMGVLVSLRVTTVRQAQLTLTLILVLLGFVLAAIGAVSLHLLPNALRMQLASGLFAPPVMLRLTSLALPLLLVDAALYIAASNCFRRNQLLAD